jgi:hypothetical protein
MPRLFLLFHTGGFGVERYSRLPSQEKWYDSTGNNVGTVKPEKYSERLRGVGNSSGDENGRDSMK